MTYIPAIMNVRDIVLCSFFSYLLIADKIDIAMGQGGEIRTFVDDAGVVHTIDKADPTFITSARTALALYHQFGIDNSRVVGTYGVYRPRGSQMDLDDPDAKPIWPTDPTADEIQFLRTTNNLSPECFDNLMGCQSFNVQLVKNINPDVWVYIENGLFFTGQLMKEVIEFMGGRPPIYISTHYERDSECTTFNEQSAVFEFNEEKCTTRSLIDVIERTNELAAFLGIENPNIIQEKESMCESATKMSIAAQNAQNRGVRVMAINPFLTGNSITLYPVNPLQDPYLRTYEELGVPLLHAGKHPSSWTSGAELIATNEWFTNCKAGQSPIQCNDEAYYPIDLWLLEGRRYLNGTKEEDDFLAKLFPDKALLNRQYAHWPMNDGAISYRSAARTFDAMADKLTNAIRVYDKTRCTKVNVTSEEYLNRAFGGLQPADYACYDTSSQQLKYLQCDAGKKLIQSGGGSSLAEEDVGVRTFIDDAGTVHTIGKSKPTFISSARASIALHHQFNVDSSQLVGTYGPYRPRGSLMDLEDPNAQPVWASDPTAEEVKFLRSIRNLSPTCYDNNQQCKFIDVETTKKAKPDLWIYINNGFWFTGKVTGMKDIVEFMGRPPIIISTHYEQNSKCTQWEPETATFTTNMENCVARSLIDVIDRTNELANFLGIEMPDLDMDKGEMCDAANELSQAAEVAQQKGIRVMAITAFVNPFMTGNSVTLYPLDPLEDPYLRTYEELGVPMLHPGKHITAKTARSEQVPTRDWFVNCGEDSSSFLDCNDNAFYPIDLWLMEGRRLPNGTQEEQEFLLSYFPDKALISGQYSHWPLNDGPISYKTVTRTFRNMTNKLNSINRVYPRTTCTKANVTSEEYLRREGGGLPPGEYACYDKESHQHKYLECPASYIELMNSKKNKSPNSGSLLSLSAIVGIIVAIVVVAGIGVSMVAKKVWNKKEHFPEQSPTKKLPYNSTGTGGTGKDNK